MAWLLSTPALPSRQVNMADGEWIFHLFERHHSKSRIFERMENILSDCCHPWTENPSNNVFMAVNSRKRNGYVDCQRGQIDWPKSVFYGGPLVPLLQTVKQTRSWLKPCFLCAIVLVFHANISLLLRNWPPLQKSASSVEISLLRRNQPPP